MREFAHFYGFHQDNKSTSVILLAFVQQSVYLLHQWTENCVCWDQDSQFNISDGVVCHCCQSLHCLTAVTQIPGAAGSSLMLT